MAHPDSRCGSCSQHEEIGRLAAELTDIHRVHIETIRELARQFESEVGGWKQKHQEAVGRECGALCHDIDNDRRLLEDELVRLRQEGVPGVIHQIDRDAYRQAAHDRDRYVDLFNRTVVRRRELIGAARSGSYAVQVMGQVETMLAVALGRPGEVYRDQVVTALAELIGERDRFRDGTMRLFDNAQLLDTLVAGIGEAAGREATTANALELFDHLVSTYREQARDVKVLEHTDSLDVVAAEARTRDAEQKLQHATEEIDRLLTAVNSRGAELAAALVDAATQRGRVAELELGNASLAGLVNDARGAAEASAAEANMLTEKLDAAERRITQLEEDAARDARRHAGLESAAQATGRQLTQALLTTHKQHKRERAHERLLAQARSLIDGIPAVGSGDWMAVASRWIEAHDEQARARYVGPFGRDWLEGFRLWAGTDGQKSVLQLQHNLDNCIHVVSWRLPPTKGVNLLALIDGAAEHVAARHLQTPDEGSGSLTEATGQGHGYCDGPCDCDNVPSQPTEVDR